MIVCYIQNGYYPGNVPFYVHTQLLGELGCEVHAIAIRRPDEPSYETINHVKVHRVSAEHIAPSQRTLPNTQLLKAVHQELSKIGHIDIAHVNNAVGVSLLPIVRRNDHIKWLIDIRSPPLHANWRATLSNYRIRLEAYAFDAVFVHAESVGEAIFGTSSQRFIELPIGVDFNHFKPGSNQSLRKSFGINETDTVLIYSGTISRLRQLNTLLQGFRIALSRFDKLHLIIVGEGDDRELLEDLALQLDIAEQVHFAGFVDYLSMPDYLRSADLGLGYVPITPWYDNAPVLKTLESLAMGLPTIATATQGNKEYIRDGENGMLVEGSANAVADAIVQMATHPELSQKFSQAARESIREYDFRRIVHDTLFKTYQELCRT